MAFHKVKFQVFETLLLLVTICTYHRDALADKLLTPCYANPSIELLESGFSPLFNTITVMGQFTWKYPESLGGHVTEYFEMECNQESRECAGFKLGLDAINRGKMTFTSNSVIHGAKLIENRVHLARNIRILWGDYTFFVSKKAITGIANHHEVGQLVSKCFFKN